MTLPTPAEWRPVPGYPDYLISSEGEVVSLRRGRRVVMAQHTTGSGYRTINLVRDDDGKRNHRVHRLVLLAFVGPCPANQEVRHLDGYKTNNRLSNLAYGTRVENAHDNLRHGAHGNLKKTHCPAGHPYDDANTVVWMRDGRPSRACRTCSRARWRRYARAKKLRGGDPSAV